MSDKAEHSEYGQLLLSWMGSELSELYRRHVDPAPAGTLTMGCTVWGQTYIDRFLALTAPTLKAQMGTLRGCARLLIFTDIAGFSSLWKFAREMQADGVPSQVLVIPDVLMAQLPKRPNNKFQMLGATQNLSVQIAARHGTAFCALFPDVLYSAAYFRNLFRLGAAGKSVVHSGISAKLSIMGDLAPFTHDGAISIPGIELGDLGYRHLHGQSDSNTLNEGRVWRGFPPSFCTIWQARDRLSYHCCHTNPAWMPADLCAKATVRYFSPIDCNLPYLLGDFYVPTLADDMVMVEVSDDAKRAVQQRVDVEHFAAAAWHIVNFRDEYLPYFAAANDVPIKPRAEGLDLIEIRNRHALLVKELASLKETVRGRMIQKPKEAA